MGVVGPSAVKVTIALSSLFWIILYVLTHIWTIKMPVVGLPIALELSLTSMLEQNILSSWKITGGNIFGTVTLHFKMANNPEPTSSDQPVTVHYRKKPPSHVNRDRKRMDRHKGEIGISSNSEKGEVSGEFCDKIEVNVSHISDTCMETSAAQVEINSQQTHNKLVPMNSEKAPCHRDTSECIESTTKQETSKVNDSNQANSTLKDNECENILMKYKCDICCKELTKSWIRCTECGYFNMCHGCYKQTEHFSHLMQTHEFMHPMGYSEYCDSCGQGFRTRNATYYQCITCDNYALCPRCKADNMHRKHSFIIKSKAE